MLQLLVSGYGSPCAGHTVDNAGRYYASRLRQTRSYMRESDEVNAESISWLFFLILVVFLFFLIF